MITGYVFINGKPNSVLAEPQSNVYASPRIFVNRNSIRTCFNIRQDGDLITAWDEPGGHPDIRVVWKLTGATHPEFEDYLEAIWPD